MQKNAIMKLLNLPNVEVVKVLDHHDESLHLYVNLINPVEPVSSACGEEHRQTTHGIGWIRVEDLPMCRKRAFLYVPKARSSGTITGAASRPWMSSLSPLAKNNPVRSRRPLVTGPEATYPVNWSHLSASSSSMSFRVCSTVLRTICPDDF